MLSITLDVRNTSEGRMMESQMSIKNNLFSPKVIRVYLSIIIKASITYSKDGFRKFGDHVMLFNGKI